MRHRVRLTSYTDYAFRLLMFAALNDSRLVTIKEVADVYGISKNHLMKVAFELGRHGLLQTVRGRKGGVALLKPANRIGLGEVVRLMEDDLVMVECFAPATNNCPIARVCSLSGVLHEALKAYIAVLDRYTLADLVRQKPGLMRLLKAA